VDAQPTARVMPGRHTFLGTLPPLYLRQCRNGE